MISYFSISESVSELIVNLRSVVMLESRKHESLVNSTGGIRETSSAQMMVIMQLVLGLQKVFTVFWFFEKSLDISLGQQGFVHIVTIVVDDLAPALWERQDPALAEIWRELVEEFCQGCFQVVFCLERSPSQVM